MASNDVVSRRKRVLSESESSGVLKKVKNLDDVDVQQNDQIEEGSEHSNNDSASPVKMVEDCDYTGLVTISTGLSSGVHDREHGIVRNMHEKSADEGKNFQQPVRVKTRFEDNTVAGDGQAPEYQTNLHGNTSESDHADSFCKYTNKEASCVDAKSLGASCSQQENPEFVQGQGFTDWMAKGSRQDFTHPEEQMEASSDDENQQVSMEVSQGGFQGSESVGSSTDSESEGCICEDKSLPCSCNFKVAGRSIAFTQRETMSGSESGNGNGNHGKL